MASSPHKRARTLIRDYLDPSRRWSAADDAEMRALIRDDEALRALYRDSIVHHRAMLGRPVDRPSGFEQRRMREAVVSGAAVERQRSAWLSRRGLLTGFGTAVAAACAVILVVSGGFAGSGEAPPLARGPGEHGPRVGLGVSGITEAGSEYEVVASGEAFLGDYFRFYYSNERDELTHLFVVGLQDDTPLIWYAPLPPEEQASLPITTGLSRKLPFENKLGARHRAGDLKVIALFTRRPLRVDTVREALDPELAAAVTSDLSEIVRARLELAADEVVQVIETRIEPGHHEEASP